MSEATYWITKRERCLKCYLGMGEEGDDVEANAYACPLCEGYGYIETQIEAEAWLVEVLGRVRWRMPSPTGGSIKCAFDKLRIMEAKDGE